MVFLGLLAKKKKTNVAKLTKIQYANNRFYIDFGQWRASMTHKICALHFPTYAEVTKLIKMGFFSWVGYFSGRHCTY